jgi:cytochrome P450
VTKKLKHSDLSVQRIPSEDWTFKDGLTIPAGTTLAFPSYHHNRDEAIHGPDAKTFDAKRYLRKREEPENAHKFHFASSGEDMMNWCVQISSSGELNREAHD